MKCHVPNTLGGTSLSAGAGRGPPVLNFFLGSRIRRLLLVLSVLDTLCTRVGITQGHNQGFTHEHDVNYLMEADAATAASSTSSHFEELSSKDHVLEEDGILTFPVRFDPGELDFKNQPIGLPVLRKVTVFNLNAQSSIQMLSISGNTIHFHCSFFADKVIPPSGNTSFDVVFLGRDEGPVENTLYIHTSAGSFRFVVRATGTPNPYRLRPLVGVKMPLNSSYSPMIQLHNPHPEPIQVLEMYSSGGDLHLELPGGEMEGPQALWEIPPFQTKSVMKANFLARLESNHTAYIRIKTNTTGAEFLYLPLEVEVSSAPGIYCPQELIDFGLVPSDGEAKTTKLLVLNSGQRAIPVQNVVVTPVSEAVTVSFRPQKISPDTLRPAVVAQVTFDPSLVSADGIHTGRIVIKSKNSQFKVTIPYHAHVITGGLRVTDERITRFHMREEKRSSEMTRNFSVKNTFPVAVAVHNVSLGSQAATNNFKLTKFSPVVIGAGQTKDVLFVLSLKPEAWENDRVLDTYVTIFTNVTVVKIPLVCFHGLVKTFLPDAPLTQLDPLDDKEEDGLDFGTLGMEEKRDLYFTVLNKNPVTLTLKNWGANLTGSLLELMGVEKGGEPEILARAGNYSGMSRVLELPPGHFMAFRVGIFTPASETGETNSSVWLETQFQRLDVKFKFRVAKGSLSTVPSELVFEPAFPGKSVRLKLKVFSSFSEEMITDSVTTKPANGQFSFKHTVANGRSTITPSEKSFVGYVTFDPAAECREHEDCYTGFPITSKLGKEWFKYVSLIEPVEDAVATTDAAIGHALQKRFRTATSGGGGFNVTLNLDTNKVRGFLFRARASLVWPRLTVPEEARFPLTQVGNSSVLELFVTNPADSQVYIHLVPFAVYPSANVMLTKLMPPWAITHLNGSVEQLMVPVETEAAAHLVSAFKILNVQDDNGTLIGLTSEVERKFGRPLNPNTKAFKLAGGHRARIRVRFTPEAMGTFRSGIFIRNNLTGVEMATFGGESVNGEFKLGKFKHNHPRPEEMVLDFDMREKHLKDCEKGRRYSSPMLSVKRSIKMKNTGTTTLYIQGFEVEGLPCEGYGFKVLNCQGFDLPPSDVREIDIAFSPDFTLTKVSRKLTILTNINKDMVNYTLVATLPPHMLGACGAVLPRPTWETWMYHIVNVFMAVVLVIVLVSAFMDSDRIVRFTAYSQPAAAAALLIRRHNEAGPLGSPPSTEGYQRLDLRDVADKVNQELRSREGGSNSRPKPIPKAKPSLWCRMVATFSQGIESFKASIAPVAGPAVDRPSSRSPTPHQQQQNHLPENRAQEQQSSPLPYKRKGKKGKKIKANGNCSPPACADSSKEKAARSVMEDLETSSTTTESSDDHRLDDEAKKDKRGKSQAKSAKAELVKTAEVKKPAKLTKSNSGSLVKPTDNKKSSPAAAASSPKPQPKPSTANSSPKPAAKPVAVPATPTPPPFEQPERVLAPAKKAATNVPVGKILPEPKVKQENKFGPVGANKPSGAAVTPPPVVSGPPVQENKPTVARPAPRPPGADLWHSDTGLFDVASIPPPPSFSSGSPAAAASAVGQRRQPTPPHQPPGSLGFGEGYQVHQDYQAESPAGPSLMKTLQEERRQMTEKYLNSAASGSGGGGQPDWPGFDNNTYMGKADFISNLWDYNRQDGASATTNGQQQQQQHYQPRQQQPQQFVGGISTTQAAPTSAPSFGGQTFGGWPASTTTATAAAAANTISPAGFWNERFGGFSAGPQPPTTGGGGGGGGSGLGLDVASIWSNPDPSPPPPPTQEPRRSPALLNRQASENLSGLNTNGWGMFHPQQSSPQGEQKKQAHQN